MSIPVEIEDLARALADYEYGYLVSSRDGRTRVVTVEPVVADGGIVVEGVGRGSTANLDENPSCTLIFPPAQRHGYTLLVDGTGTVDAGRLVIRPETAVLHRPTAHADGPPAPGAAPGAAADCVSDCRPVPASG